MQVSRSLCLPCTDSLLRPLQNMALPSVMVLPLLIVIAAGVYYIYNEVMHLMSKSLVRNKVVVITDAVSGVGTGKLSHLCFFHILPHIAMEVLFCFVLLPSLLVAPSVCLSAEMPQKADAMKFYQTYDPRGLRNSWLRWWFRSRICAIWWLLHKWKWCR